MRSPLRFAALFLLLVASSARAEVLVYAGSVQRLATGDIPAAQKRKAFVVVDQFQRKIAIVTWGKDVIGKRHDFALTQDIDFFTFPRTDGKIEDGFATAEAIGTFTGLSGGAYATMFLHGARVNVVVAVVGDLNQVQPRAKVLTGTTASAGTTILGAFYNQDVVAVKFNQKRTIEENGAGSTVAAAIAHLVGVLEAMGYVSK